MSQSGEKLSLGLKLAYGAPSVAGAAMIIPVLIHVNPFYSDTVLVPLAWVALAQPLARIFDAILDPFAGWLSDHTRSRWGRRRPWIFVAAPLAAVVFIALFTPPKSLASSDAALWLGASLMLFFMLNTAYGLPHAALGPEMTLDYHERSTLFSVREGFALLGTLVAAAAPTVLLGVMGGDARSAYFAMSAGFALVMVALYWTLVFVVRERPDFSAREVTPLFPGVRRALRNRPFRILGASYIVGSIPGAIPGLLMPYFNRYVLNPPPIPDPEAQKWLGAFLFTYFFAGLLFLPLWLRLAKRYGKQNTWLASFVPGVVGGLSLFLLGPGDNLACLAVIALSGSSFGAGLFLPPAIQADVVDYDELYTGKRREAQYLAFWGLVPKFIIIPSASIPLAVLASLGYVPNQPQSEQVLLALRAMFAITPAAFSILAFIVAWRFPITEGVHRAILEGIRAHRRGDSARDPLTGGTLAPPAERGVDEATGWFLDYFSPGELRRVSERGPAVALRDVQIATAISAAVTVALAVWATGDIVASGGNPGAMAVVAIVAASFAFMMFAGHLSRIGPALRLRTAGLAPEVLRAHLAEYEGGEPAVLEPRAEQRAVSGR
jgi:GPH family glycoside/pentoside/hexuronide:cation symporter